MGKTPAKIKRPVWVAGLNIALVLTVGSTQAFASGPIEITDQVDLLAIGMNDSSPLSGDYVVTESFVVEAAIGSTYVAGTFTGTFDGGGFTISGLTKPLFGVIAGDESSPAATISNLTLEAAGGGVSGATIGILAVETYAGTDIENVHVVGNVNGESNVGGLIGINFGGTITNSSATGNVVGTNGVGGLAGYTSGTITNSYAIGIVSGTDDVGGLIGYSQGTITDSYTEVTVTGTGDIGRVGGLAGYASGTITNSYAKGDVTGDNYVGGLVGQTFSDISNSYANGDVTGDNYVGGLVGQTFSDISNSYASGDVTGDRVVGGLAGSALGEISNSYASGNIEFDIESLNADSGYFGGLAGEAAYQPITNSYASGNIEFDIEPFHPDSRFVGGFLGFRGIAEVVDSYASGNVNDTPCEGDCWPLNDAELLVILNTGFEDPPIFALDPGINSGRPYLISNNPFSDEDEVVEDSPRYNFSFLPTQALNGLSKSVGFEIAKSDLSKLDLAFLDQVKDENSAPIIGAKLFANQSLTTSLSVGNLLQLEINFEANKSLQMWVKSSDGQYVLVGDITFDKDGNAVLSGIEFKKSGSYELIFVNSDKKNLDQPELVNKMTGLTVYVN
jgi:hypothetical protein